MDAKRYIVLLSKMSVKKLSTITLLITFILLTGVTEEESIDLYMNKLRSFSETRTQFPFLEIITNGSSLYVSEIVLYKSNLNAEAGFTSIK